jgi:hypothetical protein
LRQFGYISRLRFFYYIIRTKRCFGEVNRQPEEDQFVVEHVPHRKVWR